MNELDHTISLNRINSYKEIKYKIATILFFSSIILLSFFPRTFSENIELCPSKIILNHECPGCGITHSFFEISRFNLERAVQYNPLGILLYGYFIISIVINSIEIFRVDFVSKTFSTGFNFMFGLLLCAFTFYNLINYFIN